MSNVNTNSESISPTVNFTKNTVTVAGDQSGRTADYDAYMRDLEERSQRTAEFQAKRQQSAKREVNLIEELDAALVTLEAGATDFEQTHGKS